MYKFIPVICLVIFVAACSSPISNQAKQDLAASVNCATAREDITNLRKRKGQRGKNGKRWRDWASTCRCGPRPYHIY